MNTQDLMLNNIVTDIDRSKEIHFPTGILYIVKEIQTFKLMCVNIIDSSPLVDYIEFDISNISAIPIYDIFLISLGFSEKKDVIYSNNKNTKHFILERKDITIIYEEGHVYKLIQGMHYFLINNNPIKYIHELQNILFYIDNNIKIDYKNLPLFIKIF